MKKLLTHILLLSFVFQIGHSMAIGNVLHKIIYEISSFYNDESELSFFDFVFKDVMCETQQNEEQTEKNLSSDLYCKNLDAHPFSLNFKVEQKTYLTLSALFNSGFYFSLIQPPD